MNILEDIIVGMNKEQVRYFKLFAMRAASAEGRKDITLFDHIRKHGDIDKVHSKLYATEEKNAFYRLRNRLMQDVFKSLTIQHFEDDDAMHVLHMLALVRHFLSRSELVTAGYLLRKAEAKALKLEAYDLLDIIYSDFIKLSYENLTLNPEEYIAKRKLNQEKIGSLRAIDDILAVVSYRLKVTQNFSAGNNRVLAVLEKAVRDAGGGKKAQVSHKLRFRIYQAVSQILLQRREYKALEEFLLNTYNSFNSERLFNKSNHDTKLQMLVFLINTLFKNNKSEESLRYAEKLKTGMEEHNQLLADKYLFFYYNSLVINYSKTDPDKAIEILNDLKDNKKIKSSEYYQLFVHLNLAVLLFDKQRYKESIRHINKIYLLENFKLNDNSLKLKIAIAELLIRHELGDNDVLDLKIEQVRNIFKKELRAATWKREKTLIEILILLNNHPDNATKPSTVKKIKQFITIKKREGEGDDEIINYNNWMNDKLK